MNTNCSTESIEIEWTEFHACVGLDWGDKENAFALLSAGAAQPECGAHPNTPEAVHAWLRELGKRFGGHPVAVAIECGRAPLLEMFGQYAWLTVYPVNPATSARFRAAFTVSGAKDDGPDSLTLLEILRLHRHKLTPASPADPATRRLDGFNRLRRSAVESRAACAVQLQAALKEFFPQAIELAGGDFTAPVALAFVRKWEDLIALKAARPATIRSFYYKHNVRRPEAVEKRLEKIKSAVALSTDEVPLELGRLKVRQLADEIETLSRHITILNKRIAEAVKEHPNAAICMELPGAGPALGPRLAAGLGVDRTRFPNAASLQKYAGMAPVIEKSGSQFWVHWRWNAPDFLRQTFVEWAAQTVRRSEWAGVYYKRMVARGKSHHVIIRALAFKWIRILWKCWTTNTPYDEQKYLQSLKKRNSPNHPQFQAKAA